MPHRASAATAAVVQGWGCLLWWLLVLWSEEHTSSIASGRSAFVVSATPGSPPGGAPPFRRQRIDGPVRTPSRQLPQDLTRNDNNDDDKVKDSVVVRPLTMAFDRRPIDRARGVSEAQDARIDALLDDVLPAAAALWARHLHRTMTTTTATLEIVISRTECGVDRLDAERSFDARTTDVVILVDGDPDGRCAPRQLGYAKVCTLDADTDRPLVGLLNFCLNNNSDDDDDDDDDNRSLAPDIGDTNLLDHYQASLPGSAVLREEHLRLDDVEIAVHELGHVLGFASTLYPYFRDVDHGNAPRTERGSDGEPVEQRRVCGNGETDRGEYPSDETVQVMEASDGTFQQFLVTPRVQTIARNHFNCPTLLGGRLDFTTSACLGSHWSERHYLGHLFGPRYSTSSENVLSTLTLALMEDSGWYQVDYRGAEMAAFGLSAGCDFVTLDCIDNDNGTVPAWAGSAFCNTPIATLDDSDRNVDEFSTPHVWCDPGHRAWTACDLVQYSSSSDDDGDDDDSAPTYFPDARLAPFFFTGADHCPRPDVGLGLDCTVDAPYNVYYRGETVGASSRCVNARSMVDGMELYRPACLELVCDRDSGKIVVNHGDTTQVCDVDGQELSVPGQDDAVFICPKLAAICPLFVTCPNGCFGRGECVYDGSGPPKCRCFDSTNEDASCAPPAFAGQDVVVPSSNRPVVSETATPTEVPSVVPVTESPTTLPTATEEPMTVETEAPTTALPTNAPNSPTRVDPSKPVAPTLEQSTSPPSALPAAVSKTSTPSRLASIGESQSNPVGTMPPTLSTSSNAPQAPALTSSAQSYMRRATTFALLTSADICYFLLN